MHALWPSSKPRRPEPSQADQPGLFDSLLTPTGEPLLVPVDRIGGYPHIPRTEFPESEIGELADDICRHGVLQPIVVHPANAAKRYRIRFGAMRLRAALRAGLTEVPVTICARDLDAYAQVAENQNRHGLSPLDLARFIRGKVDAGASNAVIAKRLGIDQTTIAHHLALAVTCGGGQGTCTFTNHGDELWVSYTGSDGANDTVFGKVTDKDK